MIFSGFETNEPRSNKHVKLKIFLFLNEIRGKLRTGKEVLYLEAQSTD